MAVGNSNTSAPSNARQRAVSGNHWSQQIPTPRRPNAVSQALKPVPPLMRISFLLLYFTARDEYYYLRYETMKTFWDRGQNGGKKHFSYTELETSFFLPRTGSSVLVPYLNGIQKDLEIRDSKAD